MKRALLIGINYIGTPNQLAGCINDIDKIEKLLKEAYGYSECTKITDVTDIKPTKVNILKYLSKLVMFSRPGDELVLYYSGHGTCTSDINADESDNVDEAICALDDIITDDELFPILCKAKGKLYMFFDACHSGTMADLEFNWRPLVSSQYLMSLEKKVTQAALVMFSGCLDPQTSADASFKRTDNEYEANGAFTYCLLETLAENKGIKNKDMIKKIHAKLTDKGFQQIPQLSCSRLVDFGSVFLS